MEAIDRKLDVILEKIIRLEARVARIEGSCKGMDSHIGFVEGVYETLRSPMDYISSQVGRWTGEGSKQLPELEDKRERVLVEY